MINAHYHEDQFWDDDCPVNFHLDDLVTFKTLMYDDDDDTECERDDDEDECDDDNDCNLMTRMMIMIMMMMMRMIMTEMLFCDGLLQNTDLTDWRLFT